MHAGSSGMVLVAEIDGATVFVALLSVCGSVKDI